MHPLGLTLVGMLRTLKGTRRATKRCSHRMRRALKALRTVEGANVALGYGDKDSEGIEDVFKRTCAACGRCRLLGVKGVA